MASNTTPNASAWAMTTKARAVAACAANCASSQSALA
jgi:hypothetical protein